MAFLCFMWCSSGTECSALGYISPRGSPGARGHRRGTTGAFIYVSLLENTESYLCLKEPFSEVYQHRLALSAGVRVNFKWMCLRSEKWKGKREKMSPVTFEKNKERKQKWKGLRIESAGTVTKVARRH